MDSSSQESRKVKRLPPQNQRRLNEEQLQLMVREYIAGDGIGRLGQRWGYHPVTVAEILRQRGVKMRTRSEGKKLDIALHGHSRPGLRYSVRHDYFAKVETPEVARWLGFLAADGCISKRSEESYYVIVNVHEQDRRHLEAFARAMEYTGPLTSFQRKSQSGETLRYARLAVTSRQMALDLIRHGVTPKKSLTLLPWAGDPQLERFWFGGLVDGDGTVFNSRTRAYHWMISLVGGSLPVVQAFADFTERYTGDKKTPKPTRKKCWNISYSHRDTTLALARLLYDDLQGSCPLERKKIAADQLIIAAATKGAWHRWNDELTLSALEEMRKQFGNWQKVAAHLGITPKRLYHRTSFLRRQS